MKSLLSYGGGYGTIKGQEHRRIGCAPPEEVGASTGRDGSSSCHTIQTESAAHTIDCSTVVTCLQDSWRFVFGDNFVLLVAAAEGCSFFLERI